MRQETEAAVEAANAAFYTAVESGDLDLLEALWVDGAPAHDAVCVHPGWPMLRGRPEVLRSFAVIMANTPYIQFFLTDVETKVAGEIGVVTCVENILTGLEGGDTGGFAGGKVVATNVFRRTPGGWRLWVHHASPVIAEDDEDDEAEDEGSG